MRQFVRAARLDALAALRILLQITVPAKLTIKFFKMILQINGNPREFQDDTLTVAGLVQRLGLMGKRLAIERNGEIVPRGSYENITLASGDKLEIVGAVGGG